MNQKVSSIEPCIQCGCTDFITLHTGSDYLYGNQGVFSIDQCLKCQLITIHPRLSAEESEKYYPEHYLSFPIAVEDEKSKFKKIDRWYGREKKCQEIIKRTSKPGRILDIGCATGIFLSGMKLHGWECYGVEPSGFAAKYAKERFQMDVYNGYLEDAKYPDNFFDVVTLWDVLEHISDPINALLKISKILKPDGLLVINLPNAASWERFIFGKYWVGWDIPRHYTFFTPQTIRALLKQMNFSVNEIMSFTSGHGALVLSISFMLTGEKVDPWIKKTTLWMLKSYIARIITYPGYRLMQKWNKSSFMTIFAQKDELINN
jgi:2-polyprenyl-3-methyl-5-hydroxy-6-metoxy-1,4-benzoquinol methylase